MAFTKPKTSSTARGYGYAHQQERKRRAAKHQPSDPCARCGRPLGPMGPHLHLDHAEGGGYLGFSHGMTCNISAGSSKGARMSNARRKTGAVPRPRPRQAVTRLIW